MSSNSVFEVWRQGDVLVVSLEDLTIIQELYGYSFALEIERIVKSMENNPMYHKKHGEKVVIAGEEHLHVLTGDYIAKNIGEDMYVVKVLEFAELEHPEHGKIRLGRGRYLIMRIADAVRRGDPVAYVNRSVVTGERLLTRSYD